MTRLRIRLAQLPVLRSSKLRRLAAKLTTYQPIGRVMRRWMLASLQRRILDNQSSIRRFDTAAPNSACVQAAEQFAASQLGYLCGTVYASHMLKGTVDKALEVFIQPFLKGV